MERNSKGQFLKVYNREQKVISCACGCGQEINYLDNSNRPRRFICGHHSRVQHPMQGRKMPKEFGDKIRKRLLGKPNLKNSEILKRLYKEGKITPWNKNMKGKYHVKPFSDVHKEKLSFGMKERWKDEEYRKKNLSRIKELGFKKSSIPWILGKKHTVASKLKMKQERAKQIFPTHDTKIEVKIQDYLKELGIEFFTHQYMKEIEHSYQCDIFIPVQNNIIQKTIIECDGDAFHFNPKKYNKNSKIFKDGMTAEQRWKLDSDRTKELTEKGFKVIRLWGTEINNMSLSEFQKKCKEVLIKNV